MSKQWYEHLFDFLRVSYQEDGLKSLGVDPLVNIGLAIGATGYKVKKVTLIRTESTDEGTFGLMDFDGFTYHTLELPWRDNAQMISCIPPGVYHCTWEMSPSRGHETYRLVNVPGRSGVLIHSANWGGDVAKGFKSQINGCIALGISQSILEGQKSIISSRAAVEKFEKAMAKDSFDLEIIGV